jgi:hypothetical protein
MGVQDVDPIGALATQIEAGGLRLGHFDVDDARLRNPRARWCQESDLMSQLGQAAGQPDDHPLRTTITLDRKPGVGVESYMHGGAMYRPSLGTANRQVD